MKVSGISELTDAQLLNRFQNGESSAFDCIVDRYRKPLFTYLIRLVGDRRSAEDIFQDTFLKVIKGLKNYHEQNRFSSWLFGIAHHLAIDYLRKAQRYRKVFSQGEIDSGEEIRLENISDLNLLPDEQTEHKELKAALNSAIQQLPVEQRQVFLLREHSDLTFKEISGMLERPINTVLAQMRYALLNLRKILKKEYRGEISHVL